MFKDAITGATGTTAVSPKFSYTYLNLVPNRGEADSGRNIGVVGHTYKSGVPRLARPIRPGPS